MINKEMLEEVKNRLIRTYDPVSIYLFGSYAWGSPTEDSDLDLLIVVEKSKEKPYERPVIGHRALRGLGISKDIIVYTKKEFDSKTGDVTTLGYKVKKNGKVLYARV